MTLRKNSFIDTFFKIILTNCNEVDPPSYSSNIHQYISKTNCKLIQFVIGSEK